LNILALDTCSAACSVALQSSGSVTERSVLNRTGHARLLLMMIEELLSEANLKPRDLDLVACTRGPGAFTGVRIGIAVAQGIALAADIPVAPISTLLTLAQSVVGETDHTEIAVAMDARMGELYWSICGTGQGVAVFLDAERVCSPTELAPLPEGSWVGVGDGWQIYPDQLAATLRRPLQVCESQLYPCARHILPLAEQAYAQGTCVSAAQAQPVYLRDKVAEPPKQTVVVNRPAPE
jgi:tRNA threonylcarbamoyladenosine biosynthesis protein TsaB